MLAVIKTHLGMKIFPYVLPGTLRPPCEVWQRRAGWWRRAGGVPPALSDSTRRTGSARAGGWCWSTVHPSGLRSGRETLYTHYTEIHISDLLWDYQKTKYIWVRCVCFKYQKYQMGWIASNLQPGNRTAKNWSNINWKTQQRHEI